MVSSAVSSKSTASPVDKIISSITKSSFATVTVVVEFLYPSLLTAISTSPASTPSIVQVPPSPVVVLLSPTVTVAPVTGF